MTALKNAKFLILALLPFVFGCQENYRYPCQDPENWNKQFCQKPWCSANGTCPEDLTHYEKEKQVQPPVVQPVPQTGDCK